MVKMVANSLTKLCAAVLAAALLITAVPEAQARKYKDSLRDPRKIKIVNNTPYSMQVLIEPFGRGTVPGGKTGGLSVFTDQLTWMRLEGKIEKAEAAGKRTPKVKITIRAPLAKRPACYEQVDYYTSYEMVITLTQTGGKTGPISCTITPGRRLKY